MTSSRLPDPPIHVGIIMDGNGRWAQHRNFSRLQGHNEGVQAAKRVVCAAIDLGISVLSLYSFSTENWRRSTKEVGHIMYLLSRGLRKEYPFFTKHKIRVQHIGNKDALPRAVRTEINRVIDMTRDHTAITINLAVNYGGRDEIVRSIHHLQKQNIALSENTIQDHLDTADFPDPDLIIRTGDEYRLSNFLLWQSAYAELFFSPLMWPEWDADQLKEAVTVYQHRNRRYGVA